MSKEFPVHRTSHPNRERRHQHDGQHDTQHDGQRDNQHDGRNHGRHDGESLREQRRMLSERAQQLGATAGELEVALDNLAMQAEAVLHLLRGGSLH